jgi:hypothetical protein
MKSKRKWQLIRNFHTMRKAIAIVRVSAKMLDAMHVESKSVNHLLQAAEIISRSDGEAK